MAYKAVGIAGEKVRNLDKGLSKLVYSGDELILKSNANRWSCTIQIGR